VRPTLQGDTFELKQEDKDEVLYSHGFQPSEAIALSIENSLVCFTVLIDEKPEIIFGINPLSILGNSAIIFLLSSDRINDIGVRFARHSRKYVDYFLSYYGHLFNYIHVDNKTTIKWLRSLNASFDSPKPYGLHHKLFMRFEFTR
jgi:hypothetical protein